MLRSLIAIAQDGIRFIASTDFGYSIKDTLERDNLGSREMKLSSHQRQNETNFNCLLRKE